MTSRLFFDWTFHNQTLFPGKPFSAQVAVKFVNKKMQKKEQVAHEADTLQHLQNPQVVALLDTYESPTSLMLILELWVLWHYSGNIKADFYHEKGYREEMFSLLMIMLGHGN